jgi:hypothetical protein
MGTFTEPSFRKISNQAANVTVVLRDDTGTSLGQATINLATRGHTSVMQQRVRGGQARGEYEVSLTEACPLSVTPESQN